MIDGVSLTLLRGHVSERAHHDARFCVCSQRRCEGPCCVAGFQLGQLGETEVEDLDALVPGEKQVLRFQVTMNDPLLVRCSQPLCDLDSIVGRLADGQRPTSKPFAQRLSFEKFLDDVGRSLMLADVINSRNVWMVQSTCRLGLVLEAAKAVGILRNIAGQDLDGNVALQPLVSRPVHLPHPASAQRRQDLVGAETGPG
jgi:hypothetical protein